MKLNQKNRLIDVCQLSTLEARVMLAATATVDQAIDQAGATGATSGQSQTAQAQPSESLVVAGQQTEPKTMTDRVALDSASDSATMLDSNLNQDHDAFVLPVGELTLDPQGPVDYDVDGIESYENVSDRLGPLSQGRTAASGLANPTAATNVPGVTNNNQQLVQDVQYWSLGYAAQNGAEPVFMADRATAFDTMQETSDALQGYSFDEMRLDIDGSGGQQFDGMDYNEIELGFTQDQFIQQAINQVGPQGNNEADSDYNYRIERAASGLIMDNATQIADSQNLLNDQEYQVYRFDNPILGRAGGGDGVRGRAAIGGNWQMLMDDRPGVAIHEYGHSLGLSHAQFADPTGPETFGPTETIEYGDRFDMMGNNLNGDYDAMDFSVDDKIDIGWIDGSTVDRFNANQGNTSNTGRTVELAAFDGDSYDSQNTYQQVIRSGGQDYQFSYRENAGGIVLETGGVLRDVNPTIPGSTNSFQEAGDALIGVGHQFEVNDNLTVRFDQVNDAGFAEFTFTDQQAALPQLAQQQTVPGQQRQTQPQNVTTAEDAALQERAEVERQRELIEQQRLV